MSSLPSPSASLASSLEWTDIADETLMPVPKRISPPASIAAASISVLVFTGLSGRLAAEMCWVVGGEGRREEGREGRVFEGRTGIGLFVFQTALEDPVVSLLGWEEVEVRGSGEEGEEARGGIQASSG